MLSHLMHSALIFLPRSRAGKMMILNDHGRTSHNFLDATMMENIHDCRWGTKECFRYMSHSVMMERNGKRELSMSK